MLQLDEGKLAVTLARTVLTNYIKKTAQSHPDLTDIFSVESGVFVTLHTYPRHQLRGCIGIPYPVMSLKKAIDEAAKSVTHDPRFYPLNKDELNNIVLEITILTPPSLISAKTAYDYEKLIKIGRDGLIAEKGHFKGLLLPQVPIEQGWDIKEFLTQACLKAGLPPNSWTDGNTLIYQFTGQIFYEQSPNGDIKEKKIDGSNN